METADKLESRRLQVIQTQAYFQLTTTERASRKGPRSVRSCDIVNMPMGTLWSGTETSGDPKRDNFWSKAWRRTTLILNTLRPFRRNQTVTAYAPRSFTI